jgi:hypothetical protein
LHADYEREAKGSLIPGAVQQGSTAPRNCKATEMLQPSGSFPNHKREVKSVRGQHDDALPSKHLPFRSLGEVDFIVTRMSALEEREKKVVKYFKPLKIETQSLLHCDLSVKLPTWKSDEHHR